MFDLSKMSKTRKLGAVLIEIGITGSAFGLFRIGTMLGSYESYCIAAPIMGGSLVIALIGFVVAMYAKVKEVMNKN